MKDVLVTLAEIDAALAEARELEVRFALQDLEGKGWLFSREVLEEYLLDEDADDEKCAHGERLLDHLDEIAAHLRTLQEARARRRGARTGRWWLEQLERLSPATGRGGEESG